MRVKVLWMTAVAFLIAVSSMFFAEAGQNAHVIEASGVLEEEKVTVSVPVELAFIDIDQMGQSIQNSQLNQSSKASQFGQSNKSDRAKSPYDRSLVQRSLGMVSTVEVSPGSLVRKGDTLFILDRSMAQANLAKAQAQYDLISAQIDSMGDKSSDLADKMGKLQSAEEELKSKRAQAQRLFSANYNRAQAKISQLEENLASVQASLKQAESGLLAAQAAEAQARKLLKEAEALPDSNPTKAEQVQQASAMINQSIQKQETLKGAINQLVAARSRLEQGISKAKYGLESGRLAFSANLKKIDAALDKLSNGQQSLKDGIKTISRKAQALKSRKDQAEINLKVAKKVLDATVVRAKSLGRVKDLKIAAGSVVYPGQNVMTITQDDRLKLCIYIPLANASYVKRGKSVDVMVDAEPGKAFKGKVVEVDERAVFAPSNMTTRELELVRVVKVTVEVNNEDGILKDGMPADARIY